MLTGAYKVPAYRAAGARTAHQQDAGRDLSRARPLREHVRARAPDGRGRAQARPRSRRGAPAQPDRQVARCRSSARSTAPGVEVRRIDSGDYAALLDKALEAFGWDELQADIATPPRARASWSAPGVAIFVEKSGLGPTDNAKINVDPDGAVEVITGGASLGQGFETAMAQICAEALGVDYSRVRVIHGQTDLIDHGIGAHAARATVLTGGGDARRGDDGARRRRSNPHPSCCRRRPPSSTSSTARGARGRAGAARRSRSPRSPSASRRARSSCAGASRSSPRTAGTTPTTRCFPTASTSRSCSVDRDTGRIAVERFMVAYDVGRAVNPMLIEGQLVGGCVQGLGGALSEEFVYDEPGEPLSATFADYLMPTRTRCRRSRCCSPRTRRRRAIRSGSRARARAASTAPAARSPPRSTTRLQCRARSRGCR